MAAMLTAESQSGSVTQPTAHTELTTGSSGTVEQLDG